MLIDFDPPRGKAIALDAIKTCKIDIKFYLFFFSYLIAIRLESEESWICSTFSVIYSLYLNLRIFSIF